MSAEAGSRDTAVVEDPVSESRTRPIVVWPYDSAPAEYRAVAPRPVASSPGTAFVALVPAGAGGPLSWAFHQLLLASAVKCHATFSTSGDAVYVGIMPDVPSIYERLGRAAGVDRLVTLWREHVLKDPTLAAKLNPSDLARQRQRIATFLCTAFGGPPIYDGPSLHEIRRHVQLTDADCELILAHLTQALRDVGADAATIAEVGATLAPLKRLVMSNDDRVAGFG